MSIVVSRATGWGGSYGQETLLTELTESYGRPCLAHVGYIGTQRGMLPGHDGLLLRQIAIGIFYMHYHIDMITHGALAGASR